ncbi:MAG TPA: pyridine nucleotide-disulfide oxidoreductase, partial [Deltaproteobacteria bacterium]|nr:pyridine nucleotide-disulfide oxidoreductase [Deltaproteobacteria bacterium]
GWRTGIQIQKSFALLENKGIQFLNATIESLDFDQRLLRTSTQELTYDFLVIALGADTCPEKLPGFSEEAHDLYSVSGVEEMRRATQELEKGRLVLLVSSIPFKCPAAPYEAALMLSALRADDQRSVEIELVTPEPMPMGVAGPEVGAMVVSLLEERGIRFTPLQQATRIDPEKKEIIFADNPPLSYDLIGGIPPHELPGVLKEASIVGESGWVKVDPSTMETEFEGVYALGDATAIPLPVGKPLPKAGIFAHHQADVVSHRIACKINGITPEMKFDGSGSCFIELGDGRAGYASGNFYAEPKPVVNMKKPSVIWHWGKALFEKWWLWHWF